MRKKGIMAASHSIREVEPDRIFGVAKVAGDAIAKKGFDNVINSTIGALTDDNGNLLFLKSVMEHIRNLKDSDLAAYAPIAGLPEYLEAVKKAAFRDMMPDGYIKAIATPGGSGAIRHAIWNYSEIGEKVLTSDWYWGPYSIIAREHLREITTYTLFNSDYSFNFNSFKERSDELIKEQGRLLAIINTPAHNPTGFSLTYDDWCKVVDYVKTKSEQITIFIDIAYIDFSGGMSEARRFFKLFENLPENVLILVGYSMSKAFTLYGTRCGALISITSSKAVSEEFVNVCTFSNRGTWSNGTRLAMKTLTDIMTKEELLDKVDKERQEYRELLEKRAYAFVEEAKRIGLETCPYNGGYFISIPCDNPDELALKLREKDLYLVALNKGIRFAPCAVSMEKCIKSPSIIKSCL